MNHNSSEPHTSSPRLYCHIQRSNEIREDRIHLIQSREHIYYIGTRIRILLGEDRADKSCDGLFCQPRPKKSGAVLDLHQEHAHLLEHFLL